MKTIIYYTRNEERKPFKTTCLMVDEALKKVFARGVSICSKKDQVSKKKGKEIAIGRAVKALRTKSLELSRGKTFFKNIYLPQLTDFEKYLIKKVVK